jgi:hypothetical protein
MSTYNVKNLREYVSIQDISDVEFTYPQSTKIGLWAKYMHTGLPLTAESLVKMKKNMFKRIVKRNDKNIKLVHIPKKYPKKIKTLSYFYKSGTTFIPEMNREKFSNIAPVLSAIFETYSKKQIAQFLEISTNASYTWFRIALKELFAHKMTDLVPSLNIFGIEEVFTQEYFSGIYDTLVQSLAHEASPKTFIDHLVGYCCIITESVAFEAKLDRLSVPVMVLEF